MSKKEAFGASIETREDGTATVRTAGGSVIAIDKDRNAQLDLATIESVGIYNLIEIESHQINRVLGSTSHYIRFSGGGEVQFAYNSDGKLIELSAKDCAFSLTNKNEILFHKRQTKAG